MRDLREEPEQIIAARPAPFSRTDDPGANQHVSLARLLHLFDGNPLDRFWPAWAVLFLASLAYTAWVYSPLSFMLAVHLDIAFGLMAWNDDSRAVAARAFQRVRA